MKKLSKLTVSFLLLAASSITHAGIITIDINQGAGLTNSQFSIFDEAATLWANIITGTQSVLDINLNIDASGIDIDGVSGKLGQASPTHGMTDSTFAYAIQGFMEFDIADLDNLENNNSLFDVIFHEIAHVIGFGTLWNTNSFGGIFTGTQSIYNANSGQYTGMFALAEYRKEFDANALFIPIELDGGPGTANGHWDETWAGGSSDIMTGYLGSIATLSRTTIASFADIGYTTLITHPASPTQVEAPTTFTIMLLGGFLLLLRRKKVNLYAYNKLYKKHS
ncbi:leishmanolysin-related zinc metalloendopeptidase [Shewanella psychromarinicola]|uniref:leishmanolysin-related zinc metalloendopeptidase n=1 Tax=Shewanella psychromarinicola TaxID=2487742 RepID=UPI003F4C3F03